MRAQGGNQTVVSPVESQRQRCHIVKDTPWVDGGIGPSFRMIRCIFEVKWVILRLIVWNNCKRNHLYFDRLITDSLAKSHRLTSTKTLAHYLLHTFPKFSCSFENEIRTAKSQNFHEPPRNGLNALRSATNRWYVLKCVSQKRNWSNSRTNVTIF